jgi:hypothetical protein
MQSLRQDLDVRIRLYGDVVTALHGVSMVEMQVLLANYPIS